MRTYVKVYLMAIGGVLVGALSEFTNLTPVPGGGGESGPEFNCIDYSGGPDADAPELYDVPREEADSLSGQGWQCVPNVADFKSPWQTYDCLNPDTGATTNGVDESEMARLVRDEGNACVFPGEPFIAEPGEIDTHRGPAGPITDDGINR